MNDEYFRDNFNTKLNPKDESAFSDWVKVLSDRTGNDRMMDLTDYDLRGLWFKYHPSPDDSGHFTDEFKKPNHPTFSTESIYHNTPSIPFGGNWMGGTWGPNKTFTPSLPMLKNTHDPKFLQQYFKDVEPDYRLILR